MQDTNKQQGAAKQQDVIQQVLEYAKKEFDAEPDYTFGNLPSYYVLRHKRSGKWFAVFMDVSAEKLPVSKNSKYGLRDGKNGGRRVNIVELKCNPIISNSLMEQPGYLPAYHMKRKNWITVLLDGTVDAEEIYPLLSISYDLTLAREDMDLSSERQPGEAEESEKRHGIVRGEAGGTVGTSDSVESNELNPRAFIPIPERLPQSWIVPANPHYFDIRGAIYENEDREFIWKQSNNIAAGDTVYLYITAPVSGICYKAHVLESRIPFVKSDENIQMKYAMRLKLEKDYSNSPITLAKMKEFGVGPVRGPRHMPPSLKHEIDEQ